MPHGVRHARRGFLRSAAEIMLAAGLCGVHVTRVAASPAGDDSTFAALAQDGRVHYEPGAQAYARAVAAALPAAVAGIEDAQGGAFRHPIRIVVYGTLDAYARDSGLGASRAVTFRGQIMLSPHLWSEAQRTPAVLALILTHELSHLHFYDRRGLVAYYRLPNWFLEGMAVMVSGGGGAERVSPEAARAAIAAGRTIRITDATSLFGNGMDAPQPTDIAVGDAQYVAHMYYRQAGLFLEHLCGADPETFALLVGDLLDGGDFLASFKDRLGVPPTTAWRDFVALVKAEQPGG